MTAKQILLVVAVAFIGAAVGAASTVVVMRRAVAPADGSGPVVTARTVQSRARARRVLWRGATAYELKNILTWTERSGEVSYLSAVKFIPDYQIGFPHMD